MLHGTGYKFDIFEIVHTVEFLDIISLIGHSSSLLTFELRRQLIKFHFLCKDV